MGRKVLAVAAVAAAAVPAAAGAASHYFPKPHQRCRSGYVRKTVKVRKREHGKTVYVKRAECVIRPRPSRTPTTTDVVEPYMETQYNPDGTYTDYFPISGTVYDGKTGKEVRGLPMTYTITDNTTRTVLGTFTESSDIGATCTIVASLSNGGTVRTFKGQAVMPYPACSLGSVSMPAADEPLLTASFAGNRQYAPSTSQPQGL